ncbi:MAG: hypothetical protein GY828_00300, partial [Candidatus Gracilibacteria bacterium]|nr:hypothetical protein [Candidatus Gracilibacteria bacterium]
KQYILSEFGEQNHRDNGEEIEINFYHSHNKSGAHAGVSKNTPFIGFNTEYLSQFDGDNAKLIEVFTHELTHVREGSHKWGTHEKDLDHEDSFEKLQREILEVYLKIKLERL